jgi:hypothetical protein
MNRFWTALITFTGLAAGSSAAVAHHSFVMYSDQEVELRGKLKTYRFTAPHTSILLEVKNADGSTTTWTLEGANAGTLLLKGWARDTIKPGDELILMVKPLKSGAPAASWSEDKIKYSDGKPVEGQGAKAAPAPVVAPGAPATPYGN